MRRKIFTTVNLQLMDQREIAFCQAAPEQTGSGADQTNLAAQAQAAFVRAQTEVTRGLVFPILGHLASGDDARRLIQTEAAKITDIMKDRRDDDVDGDWMRKSFLQPEPARRHRPIKYIPATSKAMPATLIGRIGIA